MPRARTTYLNEIRIEPFAFKETIRNLAKLDAEFKAVLRETVTRVIPFAEEEAVRQILDRYQISRPTLMNQSSRHGRWKFIPKYPAEGQYKGGIRVVGTRMPVMRFSVIPSTVPNQLGIRVRDRTPVMVRITRKGRSQSGKPNVFLAKMKSGHIGVYKRKFPNPGGPRRKRPDGQWTQLPITEEYMLSVPEMLSGKRLKRKFDDNVDKFARRVFQEEMKKIPRRAWRDAVSMIGRF